MMRAEVERRWRRSRHRYTYTAAFDCATLSEKLRRVLRTTRHPFASYGLPEFFGAECCIIGQRILHQPV